MNFWVGICHWDPEPLARTKTSSAQFFYSLPDQTGLKLFFETISVSTYQMKYCLSSLIKLPNREEMSFTITN